VSVPSVEPGGAVQKKVYEFVAEYPEGDTNKSDGLVGAVASYLYVKAA
jgi:hypothetical protein